MSIKRRSFLGGVVAAVLGTKASGQSSEPSMWLVMTHYNMDDIPILVTASSEKAHSLAEAAQKRIDNAYDADEYVYATEAEEELIGADIGSDLICVSVTEFKNGKPVKMIKGEAK